MGGLDIVSDSLHANINNPASLGDLKLVTYSLGLNYKATKLSSSATNESVTSASIDYLVVAIPTKKFTFSFGILPATSVGYRLQSIIEGEDINNVVNQNEGSGGLNQTFFSIGFKVFNFLNFGVSANYNFGKITNESSRQEQNIDFGTFFNKTSSLVGFNYRFATQFKIPLTAKVRLDAMAYYVPENSLTATNESIYFTRSVSTQGLGDFENVDLEAINLKETNISLGDQYSFGLGITKEKKWFVGGQYSQRNSADYVNNFISLDNITYANGSRLSFGAFYLPDYSSITTLSFGAGAPMAPEHSGGLDDYDVPSRTAAAGESTAETIRRIIAYGGTNSAPTPDGSMERLGTVMTSAGRRSGRLTSLAATGGDTAAEDPETQATVLRSLQAAREEA